MPDSWGSEKASGVNVSPIPVFLPGPSTWSQVKGSLWESEHRWVPHQEDSAKSESSHWQGSRQALGRQPSLPPQTGVPVLRDQAGGFSFGDEEWERCFCISSRCLSIRGDQPRVLVLGGFVPTWWGTQRCQQLTTNVGGRASFPLLSVHQVPCKPFHPKTTPWDRGGGSVHPISEPRNLGPK